jgi:hypothetical protein
VPQLHADTPNWQLFAGLGALVTEGSANERRGPQLQSCSTTLEKRPPWRPTLRACASCSLDWGVVNSLQPGAIRSDDGEPVSHSPLYRSLTTTLDRRRQWQEVSRHPRFLSWASLRPRRRGCLGPPCRVVHKACRSTRRVRYVRPSRARVERSQMDSVVIGHAAWSLLHSRDGSQVPQHVQLQPDQEEPAWPS